MACYVSISGHILTADTLEEMLILVAKCNLQLSLFGGWMKTNTCQSNTLHRAGAVRTGDRKIGMIATRLREQMEKEVDIKMLDESSAVDADKYLRWTDEEYKPKAALDRDREVENGSKKEEGEIVAGERSA